MAVVDGRSVAERHVVMIVICLNALRFMLCLIYIYRLNKKKRVPVMKRTCPLHSQKKIVDVPLCCPLMLKVFR